MPANPVTPKKAMPTSTTTAAATSTPPKVNGYAGGYQPTYTPPAEPQILPAPQVENHVEIPDFIDNTSLSDLIGRIMGKAHSLEAAGTSVNCPLMEYICR